MFIFDVLILYNIICCDNYIILFLLIYSAVSFSLILNFLYLWANLSSLSFTNYSQQGPWKNWLRDLRKYCAVCAMAVRTGSLFLK